jgi:hypothetical protein
MTARNANRNRFHAPLCEGDTRTKTVGCRHANPDSCAKHSLPDICAFVRGDGICTSPPVSWQKQYGKLHRKKAGK